MQRPALLQSVTLTDGHAGNLRQARALAEALRLPTRGLVVDTRIPWRWFAPRLLPGAERAFGGELDALLHDAALSSMLVIGCGRQSALATRIARAAGARAVQILDPRIDTQPWDVVVAPQHDRLRGGNVVTLLGSLNPVTDSWLGAARAAFAAFGELPGPRTTLLVGGPTANARFTGRDLERLLRTVRAQVERDGGSVLCTTSRRTPEAMVSLVRKRLAGLPGLVWTGSVDGRNPYAALLGWADRIVCTADSVNMLSEASATRVPVFVAGAMRARGRPRRFIDALLANGRVAPMNDALSAGTANEIEPLRETARVATLLRARFGLAEAGTS